MSKINVKKATNSDRNQLVYEFYRVLSDGFHDVLANATREAKANGTFDMSIVVDALEKFHNDDIEDIVEEFYVHGE